MTTLDDNRLAVVCTPPLPTVGELVAAMSGDVPDDHPAGQILRAGFLLATTDDWVLPDRVVTDQGDTGSQVLWHVGVFDMGDLVRADLIDRINRAAARGDIGPAVDKLARAWWEYRRTTRYSESPLDILLHQKASTALIQARAHYTRLHHTAQATFGLGQRHSVHNNPS
ncbi:hypothetical protein ACQP1G_42465 [Nocardia sp. CA-107356]|uniref:hypothetical protein n=1 Tax=Nocardia sp. CA-107356 TaxID=3239972 RepID=UPI003D89BD32